MTEYAKHSAFVVKMIVRGCDFLCHCTFRACSSASAQEFRSAGTSADTTVLPLYSMPRVLSWFTVPISCAPTPYCLAVLRTAASFSGATDTTTRAPRSLNSAYSAALSSGTLISAPSPFAAKHDSATVTASPPSLISCADCTVPSAASATIQSISHFSAPNSIAGGSPATISAIVFEYSDEENSRCFPPRGGAWCAAFDDVAPSSSTITSPSLRNAIFKTFEASSSTPKIPIVGVG